MIKSRLLAGAAPLFASAALLAGCSTMQDSASVNTTTATVAIPQGTGYFASPSPLPFQTPDFSKISDEDYLPAIEQGIAIQKAEITAIANNPAPATFENTIAAMEQSGQMLSRALYAFSAEVNTNTNDLLDDVDAKTSPQLAALSDFTYLNPALFQRIEAIYNARDQFADGSEERRLAEIYYKRFIHAGAKLNAQQKEQLTAVNGELSTLQTQFSQTLSAATADMSPVFDSAEELAGLSEAEIASAAKTAEENGQPGKYMLTLVNTTQQPMLAKLTNRATREALYKASINRSSSGGKSDTRQTIARIAQLRAQKAALVGYPDFASYAMYDRMLQQPATALAFMEDLTGPTAKAQLRDAERLNEEIAKEGGNFTVEPWDWDFYAEKVRKADYDLDDAQVRPYFELYKVLNDGVFYAAELAYGVKFVQRTDLPVWHEDVTAYTVYDKDGSELGLFYFDPFARPNKRGGAWMNNFVDQSTLMGTKPVVYNVLNIPKPPAGDPFLISFDEAETMFHEMGHALHGLFAEQTYPSISGTSTARDFVEFPSQFNENFLTEPKVLANFAKHYKTGEPIPAELLAKIDKASKFNEGYAFGEVLTAALLDMKWHALTPADGLQDVDAFEASALASLPLHVDLVPPRYRTPYFRHIWEGGYAAGYYSYIWTEVLAHDAWAYYSQNGISREAGDIFRDKVLSKGNTMEYEELYQNYAGRQPEVSALVKARGLDGE